MRFHVVINVVGHGGPVLLSQGCFRLAMCARNCSERRNLLQVARHLGIIVFGASRQVHPVDATLTKPPLWEVYGRGAAPWSSKD